MKSVMDLDSTARNVIAEGRHAIEPPPGVRERVRQRVLVRLGVTSVTLLASRSSAATVAKLSCVGAVMGGVISGAVYLRTVADPVPATAPSSVIGLTVHASATSDGSAAPLSNAPSEPEVVAASTERATMSAPPPGGKRASSPAPALMRSRELTAQIELLAQANAALNRGDATTVRQTLLEYDRRFGAGMLVEERALAQILLLCGQGNLAEAKSAAARFDKRWPRSPLKLRIERTCAGARE